MARATASLLRLAGAISVGGDEGCAVFGAEDDVVVERGVGVGHLQGGSQAIVKNENHPVATRRMRKSDSFPGLERPGYPADVATRRREARRVATFDSSRGILSPRKTAPNADQRVA